MEARGATEQRGTCGPATPVGALAGVRVLELGGIGPGPFAGMMLADMGATVTRVAHPRDVGVTGASARAHRVLGRGRRSIAVDLKSPAGVETVLELARCSDVVVEGFRPGVLEALGLGPGRLMAANRGLVVGRMTGWGQAGPYADRAGHDINYIGVAGALEPIVGADGAPVPPLNMLGDFGGGGMLLAFGVVCAVLHARRSGEGQVVDAAIVDGAATLTAMLHAMRSAGDWDGPRGRNLFDGGAPYYRVYATSDDRWVSVGAIEPPFYRELLSGLGLDRELGAVPQDDRAQWPRLCERFAARFGSRTLEHWLGVFSGRDACVFEVARPDDAMHQDHLAERGTFIERDGLVQPAPAPRLSSTPGRWPGPAPEAGEHTVRILQDAGIASEAIEALLRTGAVVQAGTSA